MFTIPQELRSDRGIPDENDSMPMDYAETDPLREASERIDSDFQVGFLFT